MNSMHHKSYQSGVVSLLVTMVMMIVITLIVLGFAEIARTEQRSSLDDQLSTQAYYAAESGINDARAIIDTALATGGTVQSKGTCADANGYNLNASNLSTIDSSHSVSYTCVLVDPTPATLTYQISPGSSSIVPLLSSGTQFASINLSWTVPGTAVSNCFTVAKDPSPSTFPDLPSWTCNAPVVRIDLLDANLPLARANWGSNTATMFLVPYDSNVVPNTAYMSSRGTATAARCVASAPQNTTTCTAQICRAAACTALGGTSYYARITSLYVGNAKLSISANNVTFVGAQATIDATGKAQDVLRRVAVSVDLTDANARKIPSAAIETEDSICKRFGVTDSVFKVYDDLNAGGGTPDNPYCVQTP